MTALVFDEGSRHGLDPVSTPTLVESVAASIRQSILAGRFSPGERLVEAELARELGVSRGPIREALALLTKDGIVTNVPRRGKFVQGFTPRLVDELYSLRRVLEPYAVSLIIEKLDDSARQRLEGAVAEIALSVAADDAQLLAQRDVAFHDLLYEIADHELLERAWLESIAGKLRILLNVTTRTLSALSDAERQHRDLLEPILAKDKRLARRRIEVHIDEAWERARRGLGAAALGPDGLESTTGLESTVDS
jgi:DNA-binding GntR family transcriptional regulator